MSSTEYDLTVNERRALDMFGTSLFISFIIIMASVFIGLFTPNQIHGRIIMIGGSSIGFLILIYTIREEDKAYKKLYPKKEE